MTIQYLKLEIFIPVTHFRILQKALQSVDNSRPSWPKPLA